MILLVLIFVSTAKTYSNSRKGEPTGLGKFTEPLIMFIKDEVALPMIEKKLPQIHAISFNFVFSYG
ncbi:MAG: hypothetical protein CM15mP121_0590 [Bacteroidota bacterium]|nr:MAG: hypothetical protein CM15mP121_0590 [Bacteroidota bacterium]